MASNAVNEQMQFLNMNKNVPKQRNSSGNNKTDNSINQNDSDQAKVAPDAHQSNVNHNSKKVKMVNSKNCSEFDKYFNSIKAKNSTQADGADPNPLGDQKSPERVDTVINRIQSTIDHYNKIDCFPKNQTVGDRVEFFERQQSEAIKLIGERSDSMELDPNIDSQLRETGNFGQIDNKEFRYDLDGCELPREDNPYDLRNANTPAKKNVLPKKSGGKGKFDSPESNMDTPDDPIRKSLQLEAFDVIKGILTKEGLQDRLEDDSQNPLQDGGSRAVVESNH